MAENNVAEIEIKTVDNTAGGFNAVATRFEEFDKQVGNLEKNLRPIQEILNAGLSSSAAVAGIAACTSSAGNLSGAFSALQSSFLGIGDATVEAWEDAVINFIPNQHVQKAVKNVMEKQKAYQKAIVEKAEEMSAGTITAGLEKLPGVMQASLESTRTDSACEISF